MDRKNGLYDAQLINELFIFIVTGLVEGYSMAAPSSQVCTYLHTLHVSCILSTRLTHILYTHCTVTCVYNTHLK